MTAPLIQGASGSEGESLTYASTDENNKEPSVYLTLFGGGAFGNQESWIVGSIKRALNIVKIPVKILKLSAFQKLVKNW